LESLNELSIKIFKSSHHNDYTYVALLVVLPVMAYIRSMTPQLTRARFRYYCLGNWIEMYIVGQNVCLFHSVK